MDGRLLLGGGGGGAENPDLCPGEEPPGGGGRGPCLPGGTPGGEGAEDRLGRWPPGSDGGPPRDGVLWFGRGVLGTGGGGGPVESCLGLGRPFGRSGALPRAPAGVPGSLGGPPLPPNGVGPLDRPPGGNTGPRLGAESEAENKKH